jgi:hypothetical protein
MSWLSGRLECLRTRSGILPTRGGCRYRTLMSRAASTAWSPAGGGAGRGQRDQRGIGGRRPARCRLPPGLLRGRAPDRATATGHRGDRGQRQRVDLQRQPARSAALQHAASQPRGHARAGRAVLTAGSGGLLPCGARKCDSGREAPQRFPRGQRPARRLCRRTVERNESRSLPSRWPADSADLIIRNSPASSKTIQSAASSRSA